MIFDDSMLNTTAIALLAIIIVPIFKYLKTSNTSKNLPPGPKGIPYFGYLPFLGRKPHLTLTKLKKKYGDIFTMYFCNERVMVVSSYQLIKEALLKHGDNYAERPDIFRSLLSFDSQQGMLASVGAQRVALRRFTLSTLRTFGMGKASLEPKIQDEILCLIEEIKKFNGQPVFLHDLLTMSIANIVCTIMYGKRMDYRNEDFQQLLCTGRNYALSLGINQWSKYLPQFIVRFFGIKSPEEVGALIYRNILNKLTTFDSSNANSNQESFISFWRTEAEKPNSSDEIFNENRLAQVLTELFLGGSDTTSTSLEWLILYLIKYPKIQEKMQTEIDNVIGRDRLPSMSDRTLMPFTTATIMESSRVSSILPLLLPHCARDDGTLANYFIPKNTTIYCNAWAVHNDPELFPDPEQFKPERFITDDNNLKRVDELIPFSIGSRQCVGEALAQMQLFLYITTILQHFTLCAPHEVTLNGHFAIVLEPIQQKICAKLR